MALTATIQEHNEFQREAEWRAAGVPQTDIVLARQAGVDARDVRVFREASASRIFVVRCPKPSAVAMHGLFPPKIMAIKQKTGSAGVAVTPRGMFVSDYDMMSMWKRGANGWEKIFASAASGASKGPLPAEATELYRSLNMKLVSRLQHGCQDDFQSAKNPGVGADRFAAFIEGSGIFLASPAQCGDFYRQHGLVWPYDASGVYNGPVAG